jgi:hypothetical protein
VATWHDHGTQKRQRLLDCCVDFVLTGDGYGAQADALVKSRVKRLQTKNVLLKERTRASSLLAEEQRAQKIDSARQRLEAREERYCSYAHPCNCLQVPATTVLCGCVRLCVSSVLHHTPVSNSACRIALRVRATEEMRALRQQSAAEFEEERWRVKEQMTREFELAKERLVGLDLGPGCKWVPQARVQ